MRDQLLQLVAVRQRGADIGDWLVAKSQMKTAERVIKRDKELSSTVCETSKDLATAISQLNRKYPAFKEDRIYGLISSVVKSEW